MYDLRTFINDPAAFAEFRACVRGDLPVQRIREAKIKLTGRCNLRCAFCRIWQLDHPEEMTTAEVVRLVDDLAALDCRKIHFSGGEPTLRDDLVEIIAHAAGHGIKTALTSNGTCMTEELATALLTAGLRSIAISLDGVTPAQHDALRGVKGTFKRTLAGLRHLKRAKKTLKAKTRVRLNMVLTRHNYHAYPDVLALAGELDATDVTALPVDEKQDYENRLLSWQLQEYNETIAPAVARLRAELGFSTAPHLIYPFGQVKDDLRNAADAQYGRGYFATHLCYVPWLNTMITWDGLVWLCCMSRGRIAPLGNVRQTLFRDIFLGKAYETVREQFRTARPAMCARCDDFLAENRLLEAALSPASPQSPAPQ